MTNAAPGWPKALFDQLIALKIGQVAYVPDAGHSRLIDYCHAEPSMRPVPLTTEEEGVALLSGAWLGGQRGALLMQSSGVGNCINMLALCQSCRFPLLMLVTMRGQWGEFNSWQVPMGQQTPTALRDAGVLVYPLEAAEHAAATVAAAGQIAFSSLRPAAVLIAQRLIGAKTFAR